MNILEGKEQSAPKRSILLIRPMGGIKSKGPQQGKER